MSDVFQVIDDRQIAAAVNQASLSDQEREGYLQFIERFPGARFYFNTSDFLEQYQAEEEVQLPEWFKEFLGTLAGAFPAEGHLSYQFDSFNEALSSPVDDRLNELWFTLNLFGWPSNRAQRQALELSSEQGSYFPIGVVVDHEDYQLAINLRNPADHRIYQYHLADVMRNVRVGDDAASSIYPVFLSPGDLLRHIARIRHGKVITEAV
ncbi:SMI1/KNR4 family protein [Deinococcus sp. 14RED07]|uniref:hypothetical protein n=1 Tax=Deinococcus sp. 14RED07 TaxID=2745874 RepID=UPI001E432707|nr:hypothetical protein [Deinococcus sp. 14RED07]MCD0175850.1 SMI1/KNR4 family protein [Deinococcus sp. 14RED07]